MILPAVAERYSSEVMREWKRVLEEAASFNVRYGNVGQALDTFAVHDNGGQVFNVKAAPFRAKGDGVTDDTSAFEAAYDACASKGGGRVVAPPGRYKLRTVTIASNDIRFSSSGMQAVEIIFDPADGAAPFIFSRGAEAIWHCGIDDFYFSSPDTTENKAMVKIVDGRHFRCFRLGSIDNAWIANVGGGKVSVGVDVYGSEQIRNRDHYIYADQPIRFNVNPNLATNSLDHSSIERCNLVVTEDVENYAVLFNTGCIVSQFEMSKVAAVRGRGIVSKTSTGAIADKTMRFRSIRHEQGVGDDFVAKFAATVSEIQNLSLADIDVGGETLGFYFSGCRNLNVADSFISRPGDEAIEFGAGNSAVTLRNIFHEAGSEIVGTYQVNGLECINVQNGASDDPTEAVLALVNGNNNDIPLTAHHRVYSITGPSGAFAVTGFQEPSPGGNRPGRTITLVNNTAQTMTVDTASGSSTATNQISAAGGDFAVAPNGAIHMTYLGASDRWFVTGQKA